MVVVSAIILLRAGELPNPTLLTYFNRLFLRDSFGLVPMPTLGLHWALYATYAAALLIAAVRFVRAHPDRTLTAMLAFAGTFGLGTGMYFVGRSSQFQLMLLFPALGVRARIGGVGHPALVEEGEGQAGGPGATAAARLRGPDRIRSDDLRARPRLAALEADRSPLDERPRSE